MTRRGRIDQSLGQSLALRLTTPQACAAAAAPLSPPPPRRVRMPLLRGTATLDAIALRVEWGLPTERGAGAAEGAPYASPYARHEIFFLPTPHRGDAPLEFEVSVVRGRVHLEF